MSNHNDNNKSVASAVTTLSPTSIEYQQALLKRWKVCVATARTKWPQVAESELVKVGGNFHKMAGLLQLRLQLTRREADRQAKEFFDLHMI